MSKISSIKTKQLSIIIISVVILATILLFQSLISFDKTSDRIIDKSINATHEEKKKELENYITLAYKTVDSFYQRTSKEKVKLEVKDYIKEQSNLLFNIIQNEYERNKNIVPPEVLKERIKLIIESSLYGKSGYFWINDFNYKMIMHPIKKELSGKYFTNTSNLSFLKSAVDKLKQTNKDNLFIEYSFYNPNTKDTVFKSSIVRVFKPYNWIIGTGAYIDDLTEKMKKEALLAISNMKYGDKGYFWVINTDHILLVDGRNPSYSNKNMYNVKNNKDIYPTREMIKAANRKDDGDFLRYYWTIPDKEGEYEKLSFVRNFKPWKFIIGTGSYFIDIEKNTVEMNLEAKENNSNMFRIVILFILMVFLIVLLLVNIRKIKTADEKIKKQSKELITLNQSLEEKVLLRTKKVEEQQVILQEIIDSQESILVITDFNTISFSNKSFLRFFNLDKKEYFEEKFESFFNILCEFGDYIHKGKISNEKEKNTKRLAREFYELVNNYEEEKKIVMILNQKFEPKTFYIHITIVDEQEGLYLISLNDITRITIEKMAAEHKAYTDGLTGIANRNRCDKVFEKELIRANRYGSTFSVALLDIDHFKKFNDTYGHIIGDEVLIMLAQGCEKKVRKLDLFARWGGEEFVILFPQTKLDEAVISAEKIRKNIEELEHKIAGRITCSFGVTEYKDKDDISTMFKRCDDALYKAKENGRNRVEVL